MIETPKALGMHPALIELKKIAGSNQKLLDKIESWISEWIEESSISGQITHEAMEMGKESLIEAFKKQALTQLGAGCALRQAREHSWDTNRRIRETEYKMLYFKKPPRENLISVYRDISND